MISTVIVPLLVLSLSIEYIVEIIKQAFPGLNSEVKGISIERIIAFIFGLVMCIGAKVDFFELLKIEFTIPYVGYVISAIFIAGGSGTIHDFAKLLRTTGDLNQTTS